MTRWVILVAVLCLPTSSWAVVDLYVDTNLGNNANACTSAGSSACATLNGAVGKLPSPVTDAYVIHCKGTAADTSQSTISVTGTSATNTITIQVDSADRHAGVWDTNKYRLQADLGTDGRFLQITVPYVRVTGLQLYNENTGSADQHIIRFAVGASSGDAHISKVIMRGARTQIDLWNQGASHTVYVWNSVGYGWNSTTGSFININSGTAYAYSVTSGGSTGGNNFRRDSGTLHIKNAYSPTFYGAGYTSHVTSAAADTTGTSGTLDNVAYSTTNFENVTAGSEDLRIKTASVLKDGGTDTSGEGAPLNFTDDIAGNARSTWDVGAFEFQDAASVNFFKRRVGQ